MAGDQRRQQLRKLRVQPVPSGDAVRMTHRRSQQEESDAMKDVADAFNDIARKIEACDAKISGWLPVRAAVEVVCGVDWHSLNHSRRSLIGAMVRDRFLDSFGFLITPVRLLRKTSGAGSHMIAVYPPGWLASIRREIESVAIEGAPAHPLLPFARGQDE